MDYNICRMAYRKELIVWKVIAVECSDAASAVGVQDDVGCSHAASAVGVQDAVGNQQGEYSEGTNGGNRRRKHVAWNQERR